MKRIFAAVAAAALLTGHAAAQTGSPAPKPGSSLTVGLPASSGSGPADVAFDEVDIFAMGPYASSPDDFAKEAAALEGPSGAAAVTPAMPPVMVLPTKRLKRFAYWRGASRVEDVLNHQVVITKPGELDTLDTVKKTYQKSTAFAIMPSFHFPAVQGASPQAKGPGTVDIALGLDAATTDPVANAGAVARGLCLHVYREGRERDGLLHPARTLHRPARHHHERGPEPTGARRAGGYDRAVLHA